MTASVWKTAVLGAALFAVIPARARCEVAGGAKRVVVFDLQADVTRTEVAQLPDLIEQIVASHPGYTAVPDSEMHPALAKRTQKTPSSCQVNDACRKQVANDLHADLIVSGTVAKEGKQYVLYLALTDVASGTGTVRTTESMKQISSLASNAKLCLGRLFHWKDEPAPAPTASERNTLSSEAIPPIAVTSQKPSRPEWTVSEPVKPAPAAITKAPVASGRRSLALISVTSGEGVSEKQSRTIEETLLTALDATGHFKVIGRSDIEALLTLEARKQTAGCNSTECAVEIAGALGVEEVATADIGKLGRTLLINLKVIDVRSASVAARAQVRAESEDALPDAVQGLARDVVKAIWPDLTPPQPPTSASAVRTTAPSSTRGAFAATWAMLGIAVAGVAVATGTGATARGCSSRMTPQGIYGCDTNYGTAADVGWGVAGAAALTGGALFLSWIGKSDPSERAMVAIEVAPTRLAIGGAF